MIVQRAAFFDAAPPGFGARQIAADLLAHAGAMLAQALLDRAWRRTLAGNAQARPWPWADTWPIARLGAPGFAKWAYVLADASGGSRAFGPGHVAGTATPGASGNSTIAGHRDTHFRFLQVLAADDAIVLETADGAARSFRIVDKRVVDTRRAQTMQASEAPMLTLVTCYPFDAVVPDGPLRYVVTAVLKR